MINSVSKLKTNNYVPNENIEKYCVRYLFRGTLLICTYKCFGKSKILKINVKCYISQINKKQKNE